MTLQTTIAAIQTAVGAVSGVKFAPDYPPDKAEDFPFVVTYLGNFRGDLNSSDDFRMLYDIVVELHVTRIDLPRDIYVLLPYAETVANAIFKALRDNAIAHQGVEGTFGGLLWGDDKTIGYTWTIRSAKVITNIT